MLFYTIYRRVTGRKYMKLFYSPFHTFIHKVLVTIHEAGLWNEVEFVAVFPFKDLNGKDQGDNYSIAAINPLDKVPTLALDNGQVVYGSQAIVECVDSMSKSVTPLYPSAAEKRWEALTRLALGDTIFETTVMLVMEGWHPVEEQRIEFFEWIWPKIIRGLDKLEAYSKRGFDSFDIGHASMLHAISYMNFRTKFYVAKDPLYPEFDFSDGRPNLKAWWDENVQRPSVTCHYNKDFAGDVSPEFCQNKIQEVLELQRSNGIL